jgi:hypothetical protein
MALPTMWPMVPAWKWFCHPGKRRGFTPWSLIISSTVIFLFFHVIQWPPCLARDAVRQGENPRRQLTLAELWSTRIESLSGSWPASRAAAHDCCTTSLRPGPRCCQAAGASSDDAWPRQALMSTMGICSGHLNLGPDWAVHSTLRMPTMYKRFLFWGTPAISLAFINVLCTVHPTNNNDLGRKRKRKRKHKNDHENENENENDARVENKKTVASWLRSWGGLVTCQVTGHTRNKPKTKTKTKTSTKANAKTKTKTKTKTNTMRASIIKRPGVFRLQSLRV